MAWAQAQTVYIEHKWAAGWSAAQIAAGLARAFDASTSRNAVLGKLSRMGLCGRKPVYIPRAMNRMVDRLIDTCKTPQHVTLFDLGAGMCKWPYGDVPPYTFCALPVQPDKPYCPHHEAVAHGRKPPEMEHAESLREDESEVQERGVVGQGSQGQGCANLQRAS